MSIIDITADPDTDGRGTDGRGTDGRASGRLSQDTAGNDWDVSEVVDSRAPEPPAPATELPDGVDGASTEASRQVSPPPEPSPVPGMRPTFTITEAATACAVSRKTITRKLTDLAEYGAAKDEDGVWRIPVEALLAVGLHPGRSVPTTPRSAAGRPEASGSPRPAEPAASPTSVAASRASMNPDVVTVPRDRWDDLRLRLARAEAEAAERALALADARLALRALTAAPHSSPTSTAVLPPGGAERPGVGPFVPAVPHAVGWVMGAPSEPTARTVPGAGVVDPGAAPPVAVVPEQPRKRRWWQSSAR